MNQLKRSSLPVKVLRALLLSLIVGIFTFFCPTPWALEAPGPFFNTRSLVQISGASVYPARGSFILLTVISEPASLLYCIYWLFNRDSHLVMRSGTQAQSGEDFDHEQMQLSQNVSSQIALAYLMTQKPDFVKGLAVRQIAPESPNANIVKKGDKLQSLDGQKIYHVLELGTLLQKHQVNDLLDAQIQRDGHNSHVKLKVWQPAKRKLLGIQFMPILGSDEHPLQIRIDSEQVSGASAGLVFCLEIINQLSPNSLTKGRIIAATGTLDLQGRVGPIEGIRFKLIGAERAQAQIFLCPKENLQELSGITTGLKIIGVSTLDEALLALK